MISIGQLVICRVSPTRLFARRYSRHHTARQSRWYGVKHASCVVTCLRQDPHYNVITLITTNGERVAKPPISLHLPKAGIRTKQDTIIQQTNPPRRGGTAPGCD
ncbi:MAG: hypothetical protein J6T13_02175 [Bacteroidales bacterium]|nr:hypothetical protein [Bacteroidales bacterium]